MKISEHLCTKIFYTVEMINMSLKFMLEISKQTFLNLIN
jgi:hypothetical protein